MRHPYKKDPKRDPNLENYSHEEAPVLSFKTRGGGGGVSILGFWAFRVWAFGGFRGLRFGVWGGFRGLLWDFSELQEFSS